MKKEYKEVVDSLDTLSYKVTQESATEPPFANKYDDHFEKGIYTDKISGKVLFYSKDKFNSGCGWPAFAKAADDNEIDEFSDTSHGMTRVEVRSSDADSHLGHVFNDGPQELGGLRYCINSAALNFIPYEEMDAKGYSEYKSYLEE